MARLRYLTAGESHGPALSGIMEGMPAGMALTVEDIHTDSIRRKMGYGRGNRMKIETDDVKILSGVRRGETLGSPIALYIENRDHQKWLEIMAIEHNTAGGRMIKTRHQIGKSGFARTGSADQRNRFAGRDR